MAPVVVFAALAAVIGLAFGLVVLNQYRDRRKPYQAIWGAALLMFGIAALCEAIGLAAGWSAADYKAYYLFGALLNVGWLAVGEVYLLAPGTGRDGDLGRGRRRRRRQRGAAARSVP
jgi:hypothetical protein